MANKIKDLPFLERPREKAFHYGIDKLSDVELLSILIASGTKENSARDIAYQLINDFGSLKALAKCHFSDLLKYKGISKIKALKLMTVFTVSARIISSTNEEINVKINNEEKIIEKYKALLSNEESEYLYIISLNYHYKIINEKRLFVGSYKNVCFSLKDVFRELLKNNAKKFYLIHNHPNGNLSPSDDDIVLTSELISEGERLGIPLVDHLIISGEGYYSFKQNADWNH